MKKENARFEVVYTTVSEGEAITSFYPFANFMDAQSKMVALDCEGISDCLQGVGSSCLGIRNLLTGAYRIVRIYADYIIRGEGGIVLDTRKLNINARA